MATPVTLGAATERRLIVLVVALAGVGGALSGASPTGQPAADAAWAAALAALVALAASRARRWTWVVACGVAAALAGGLAARLAANAVLAGAVGAVALGKRWRLAGAVVGGSAVQVLLRLPAGGWATRFHGASALAATAAIAPVLVSAYRVVGRRRRARVRLVGGLLAGAGAAAVLCFGAAVVSSRAGAERGIDEVRSGLAGLGGGDGQAAARLAHAARALDVTHARVSAWWMWPARVVPVVGHQVSALDTLSGQAADLADHASAAVTEADLAGVGFTAGRIDLPLVAAAEKPLVKLGSALESAGRRIDGARSPWLAGPLSSRIDAVGRQVRAATSGAHAAAAAARVAPALLGREGPRRYFVAFVTPAESRGLGGYMGNYAELAAVDGAVSLSRSGRTLDLMVAPVSEPKAISGPSDYVARYGRFHPEAHFGDLTYSPDFPSVARVIEAEYLRSTGRTVDGALSIDPYALAALLRLTGPIQVPGLDGLLTADNGADTLLRRQYLLFPDPNERVDFLQRATTALFDRLTTGPLPDVATIVTTLAPMVRQGRLMVHSTRPGEQDVLARVGLDGALPPTGSGDFFSLVSQNSANNKIDIFLEREVDYEATFDPSSGRASATVDVTLRNKAPAAGLPFYVIGTTDAALAPGTNRIFVSVYTPLRLGAAQVDGGSSPSGTLAMETQRELGRYVHSGFVTVGPGATAVVHLQLSGRLRAGREYRLGYAPQPLVNPDQVVFRLRPSLGWRVASGNSFAVNGEVAVARPGGDGDEVLTAQLTRR